MSTGICQTIPCTSVSQAFGEGTPLTKFGQNLSTNNKFISWFFFPTVLLGGRGRFRRKKRNLENEVREGFEIAIRRMSDCVIAHFFCFCFYLFCFVLFLHFFPPSIVFFTKFPQIMFFHSWFCKIRKIIWKTYLYNPESLIYLITPQDLHWDAQKRIVGSNMCRRWPTSCSILVS